MRFFVISLSAGLLSLASCSGPTPEVAYNRGEENTESLIQPKHQAAVNSAGADPERHVLAQIQEEDSQQENSAHGDSHAGKANPTVVKHDSKRHVESDHKNHGVATVKAPSPAGGHDRPNHAHPHAAQHASHRHQHGSGSGAHHDVSDNAKKIMIGEEVPDFEVTIDGKHWKLSELRKNAEMTKDGTLVLTFWCSFCHSCRHVELHLNELANKYKGRVGVIALDASAGETRENVARFAEKRGLTLPIALNPNGTTADIFGVRATTTTVVIDSHGVLRYRGQFIDSQHTFAEDALRAVLVGDDVPQTETSQKG